jgi:hypothetical protein
MSSCDDFTEYYKDLLEGLYDCADRIVLNGYFPMGQQGGGFRLWWRQLTGSEETLDQNHLTRMAGDLSRKVHAFAKKKDIPIIHCETGIRKGDLAQKYLPRDTSFQGLFLILVAKSPGLVWEVQQCKNGIPHLDRKKPWPYVNHYHFHIVDKEWGHITIKMSGHPPFNVQVMLNGHEWVERKARKKTISSVKEGNCFVGGSDFMALDRVADTLCRKDAIGQLAKACDRWVYSTCLAFALDTEEQKRSGFHYKYSCYQIEYSRNLLFERGSILDEVYQGLIDRNRSILNMDKVKTIFGWKKRPHNKTTPARLERILDGPKYDLTVFKVHFGKLTLKIYDKGARVLRIEAVAHNVKELRCGKILERLPDMLAKLRQMVSDFLNLICATHISYLDEGILDAISQPSDRGTRRLAGIDLQKPRVRAVSEALLTLSAKPGGFTVKELAQKTGELLKNVTYTVRQAAYDLNKFKGKNMIVTMSNSRCCRLSSFGIRILSGLIILREKVIKPVLAGICKKKIGRPPKNMQKLDSSYDILRSEMFKLLGDLNLVA